MSDPYLAVLFILLYPLGQIIATGLLLVALFRRGKSHLRKPSTILFLLHAAIFVIVYLFICLDPYFMDNGSREFIPLEERWSLALLMSSFFEPIAGPFLFIGYIFLKKDPPDSDLRQEARAAPT